MLGVLALTIQGYVLAYPPLSLPVVKKAKGLPPGCVRVIRTINSHILPRLVCLVNYTTIFFIFIKQGKNGLRIPDLQPHNIGRLKGRRLLRAVPARLFGIEHTAH